jgi:hypothetical protein
MTYDPPEEPSEWELIGVTYDGGETVEPVNPDGGGVDWRESSLPPPHGGGEGGVGNKTVDP